MKHLPLVSVVIPVYNMEAYLAETLRSVLASDYPAFEVVVMDDGSKDDSLAIARQFASADARVSVYTQPNAGACVARNQAITRTKGRYILPVDADNTISPDFIRKAVEVIESDDEVKVVAPRADFVGDRSGEWHLPPFSLSLLARKNIMDTFALYRKVDWERVGGYCEEIVAREDWEFWIAMLKDGGKVVRLSEICLHYRIRQQSKRVSDRSQKRHVVEVLNRRHPEFFERELGGTLHRRRSWSRVINFFYRLIHPRVVCVNEVYEELTYFVKVMPRLFRYEKGELIYKGRNELRAFHYKGIDMVVKSFQTPNWVNRIVYGLFRSSKAERSYRYADMLLKSGIGSPRPVGYYTERYLLFFTRSYYVSLKSQCPYTYYDLVKRDFPNRDEILRAIARTTARMHECGYLHKDYSRGNILFREREKGVEVEIIDLNRISFRKIGLEEGCKNFERLPGTDDMLAVLADEYAKARGFDAEECLKQIKRYHVGN